jgi:hydroxymethylbilane synthase
VNLRAGTRASLLAWTQAGWAVDRILQADPGHLAQRVRIETHGDKDHSTPLASMSGTGVFVKELESALLRGEIDFAIHSLKDVPFEIAAGCRLLFLSREDPRDALVSPHGSLEALPEGALVGTGSPRRIAQLRHARPDLRFADLRGNLDTRMRKLESGEFQAIVLACAGLVRLGWADRISQRLDPDVCLPAFGQGILALECLQERNDVAELLARACDPSTDAVARAERVLMRSLGGGCKTPLAALAEPRQGEIFLRGMVGDHRTGRVVRSSWQGPADLAEVQARDLAGDLRRQAEKEGIEID